MLLPRAFDETIRAADGSSGYQGPDRRGASRHAPEPITRPLLLGLAVLAGTAGLVAWASYGLHETTSTWSPEAHGWLMSSIAVVASVAAAVHAMRWRLVGAAPALWLAIALAVYGTMGIAFPHLLGSFAAEEGGAWADLLRPSGVVVVVLLLLGALLSVDVDAAIRPRRVLALGVVFGAIAAVLAAVSPTFRTVFGPPVDQPPTGPSAFIGQSGMALVWLLLGLAFLRASIDRKRSISPWIGLMLLSLAEARLLLGLSVSNDLAWVVGSQALRLAAVSFALVGGIRDLQQAFVVQRSQLLDSVARAAVEEARRRAVEASEQERRHDLHTALAGIDGAATLLERHGEHMTADERRTIVAAVHAEIDRLHAVARVADDADREFDLREALEPTVVCAAALGLDVELELRPDLAVVGRPRDLARVVQNLLENARCHAPGARVKVRGATEGDTVVVRVDDDGPGIPESARGRIFERGWRGQTSADGSGLGLFIASELVRDQGGSLRLEGRDGGGASFVLELTGSPQPGT